jgi:hypothetical protein
VRVRRWAVVAYYDDKPLPLLPHHRYLTLGEAQRRARLLNRLENRSSLLQWELRRL